MSRPQITSPGAPHMTVPLWKFRLPAYAILFLTALVIGTHFRTYPLRTHQSHDEQGKATLLVIARIKGQVDAQVERNYPEATAAQKKILKAQLLKEVMREEHEKVQDSITKVKQNIEEAGGSGRDTPYLLAADSFHFYQLTERLLETGHISNTFKGSKYLNDLMLAPKGHYEPLTLHPYVGAMVYRVIKFFHPEVDLMQALGYTPLVLTALSLAAFLLACHGLRIRMWSSLIAAIMFVCSPIFIKRSAWGWYDNDPYNTLFPLLILAAMFPFYKKNLTRIRGLIQAGILGLLMLGYAYFWQGWMLMFVVAITGLALSAMHGFWMEKDHGRVRTRAIGLAGCAVLTFILVAVFFGPGEFFQLFKEGYRALTNFLQPQLSVWPDLYISVGELHQASLFEIVVLTGGFLFFLTGVAGLLVSLTGRFSETPVLHRQAGLTLGFFLGLSLLMTLGAQRFALLCLTPLALLFAMGLNYLENGIICASHRFSGRRAQLTVGTALRGAMALLTVMPLVTLHRQMPRLLNPIYNDTWNAALLEIKDRTPPQSIINSWWPPGHFIKATAGRRVTFDGATINYPQAYWLTRAYLAQSEQAGLGILRMLNNSANDAAELLTDMGFRTSSAVTILRAITALNSRQARLLLETKIPDAGKVDRLLALTHGRPPPSYIFIYRDLVEKNIQLAFIGNWNFATIEALNEDPKLMAEVPDRSSREYVQYLWKLAGGPYKYHTPLALEGEDGDWMLFENGVRINSRSKVCAIDSPSFGRGIPQSIFFVQDGQVVELPFDSPTLGYSVTLFEEAGRPSVVLMDRYLAKSLIMRLFYFGDRGMRYVRAFTEKSDLSRQTDIRVFEVDWDAYQRDYQ